MTEADNQPHVEGVLPETLAAINTTIELKFNNSGVHRVDDKFGRFTLIDAGQQARASNTIIEISNFEGGKMIRFVEQFDEVSLRNKPSIIVYDYDLDLEAGKIQLTTTKDDSDKGLLARTRLAHLRAGAGEETEVDGEISQTLLSESQAQSVLASIQAMKILI